MSDPRSDVRDGLAWLIEYWPDLLEARLPGTPRPWRYEPLTAEQRAARDEEARQDRLERTTDALGESPAPLDVGVLSTALELLVRADDLAAEVAEHAGVDVLPPPRLGQLDARPYLEHARRHITLDLEERAAPIVALMVGKVAAVLGLVVDGQLLAVVCPWCQGITDDEPIGGAHTWRVRELPGGQVAIVCESGHCEPPAREVGTWWGGRPCWPMSEWERLARLVSVGEAAA
ncbi:hypothetical protein [Microbispora sp. NPDC049633]|uniref:hypothetical protein n=1 Tax=Microbispora sp. NPDC049633 TaxID=3154355 RepID=UPI00341BB165